MIDKLEVYKQKSNAEIKAHATKLGLEYGKKEKIDNIIERIIEVESTMQPVNSVKTEVKVVAPPPATVATQDFDQRQKEVMEYCKPYLSACALVFNDDKTITCKGNRHTATVHSSASLSNILSTVVYASGLE